jgi:hypothetical protein
MNRKELGYAGYLFEKIETGDYSGSSLADAQCGQIVHLISTIKQSKNKEEALRLWKSQSIWGSKVWDYIESKTIGKEDPK